MSMSTYSDRQPVLNLMAQSEIPDVTIKFVFSPLLIAVDLVIPAQSHKILKLHQREQLTAMSVAGNHRDPRRKLPEPHSHRADDP